MDFKKKSEAKQAGKEAASPPTHPFLLGVTRFLLTIGKTKDTEFKAKSVVDGLLANAFVWDFVASFAKSRADLAWKKLEDEGVIEGGDDFLQGDHELARSPSFICSLSVTAAVKRFDPGALADALMSSKYKVPKHITVQMVENAKKATKGQKRYKIEVV